MATWHPGGGTNLDDAYREVVREMDRDVNRQKVGVIITDGLGSISTRRPGRSVDIVTIGSRRNAGLASITGGRYWHVGAPGNGNMLVPFNWYLTNHISGYEQALANYHANPTPGIHDPDGDLLATCVEDAGVYSRWTPAVIGHINIHTSSHNPDTDGDGISDIAEYGDIIYTSDRAWALDPNSNPSVADTDNDGIEDQDEHRNTLNAYSADTDGDGLSDFDELQIYQTSPFFHDTDGDGELDGYEVEEGYDPLAFNYRFNWNNRLLFIEGFSKGLIFGDFADVDSIPELSGHLIGGLVPISDARDVVANAIYERPIDLAMSAVGLTPVAGDAAAIVGRCIKYLNKYPDQIHSVRAIARKIEERTNLDIVRHLPVPNLTGSWLKGWAVRGQELEVKASAELVKKYGSQIQELLGNYPFVDVYDNVRKRVISIKSVDLSAPSYQNVSTIRSLVRRHVKQARKAKKKSSLRGRDVNGNRFILRRSQITDVEVMYVFPYEPQKAIRDIFDGYNKSAGNFSISYTILD